MDFLSLDLISDICGWSGAICVLLAYFLISTGKVQKDNTSYHVLNLLGAFLLIFNTIYIGAYPSAFVNIIWCFVAVAGLWGRKH